MTQLYTRTYLNINSAYACIKIFYSNKQHTNTSFYYFLKPILHICVYLLFMHFYGQKCANLLFYEQTRVNVIRHFILKLHTFRFFETDNFTLLHVNTAFL